MTYGPGAIGGALCGLAAGTLSSWVLRATRHQFVLFTVIAIFLGAALGTIGAHVFKQDVQDRLALDSTWHEWEVRMKQAGCKVTSFTSEKDRTAPVWTCPNGSAHLGRWR